MDLQVSVCTMYRNFLLLDPSDTETVDNYLNSEENRRRENGDDPAVPSSSVFRGDSFIPPGDHEPRESNEATENNVRTPGNIQTPGGMDMGEPDWQGDGDEGMMWDDPHAEEDGHEEPKDQDPSKDQVPSKEAPAASNPGAPEDDNYIDPWVPLDPHEPGNLPVKPFKKGAKINQALVDILFVQIVSAFKLDGETCRRRPDLNIKVTYESFNETLLNLAMIMPAKVDTETSDHIVHTATSTSLHSSTWANFWVLRSS